MILEGRGNLLSVHSASVFIEDIPSIDQFFDSESWLSSCSIASRRFLSFFTITLKAHHHTTSTPSLNMVAFANALAGSVALIAILPQVQAHMALWHPSVYGFSPSESADAIFNPLANLPVDGAGGWVSCVSPHLYKRSH
jgi:hypothetical protein